jgi:hypothetical protein
MQREGVDLMATLDIVSKWTLAALMALGALLTVSGVGKPRKPTTGGVAAYVVVMDALFVTAIVVFWDV